MTMTKTELMDFLMSRGWLFSPDRSPWCWKHPDFRGTYYTEADALSLARNMKPTRKCGQTRLFGGDNAA
jgi:hypothetical protein